MKKILKYLGPVSFVLVSIVFGFAAFITSKSQVKSLEKKYKEEIVNVCRDVGYNYSESVSSFSKLDINNDGITDVRLVLKDESKLEYLSKGYELRK